MSCTTTTAMYLNVSTEICASASASRSGNTVTVSGTFTVTQGNSWNYNAIYAYVDGHTSWTRVKPYVQSGGTWSENFSFSFEDSGSGSPTYTAIFQVWNNAESGTVGNPASTTFSVSYPSGATTPPQPTVTLVQSYTYGAKFHVSGDYGTPSSASGRYIEAAILNQNTYGNAYRYSIASNTSSADITVTNSTYQGGGLTILPNKQYYYGGYINNTERNNSIVTGQFVTKPAAPTVSRQTLGADSAEFAWSVAADGGYRDKTISYNVNNGSFITIGTYSGSSARSGSETLTNLVPNSQNTFSVKNATVEGNEITELTFTTLPPTPTISANAESLTSVRINYQVPADGGALTKTIAYSLDGGTTWSQGATISSGDATSGSFTIDNLSPNQSYTVTIKIMTNAGAVTLEAITVSTMSDHFVMYGPQEGETITGVTGTIRAGGAGNVTAFDGTTFWDKVKNSVNSTAFSYLRVISPSGSDSTWYLYLSYTDGTPTQTIAQGLEREQLATYGITATVQQSDTNDYIDLTLVISPSGTYTAVRISEFYGPVNGETARANKVYAPVKDPTLDPYIRAGGAGNIISVDVDKLLFHIPPSRKQKDIAYIKFTAYPTMNGYKLEVYHTDSTSQYLLTAATLRPREIYNNLGVQVKTPTVNIAVDYIDFPTGYKNRFKTKIVHQAFGHLDYNPTHAGGGN